METKIENYGMIKKFTESLLNSYEFELYIQLVHHNILRIVWDKETNRYEIIVRGDLNNVEELLNKIILRHINDK